MFLSEQNAEMGMERRGGYFFSRESVFLVRNQDNSVTVLRHHFFVCASAQNLNTRKKSMRLGLYFIGDVLWWRLLLSLPFACYIVCTLVHFSKNVISYEDNNWSLCCVISSFYRVFGLVRPNIAQTTNERRQATAISTITVISAHRSIYSAKQSDLEG